MKTLLTFIALAICNKSSAQLFRQIATSVNSIRAMIAYGDSLFIGGAFNELNGTTSYYSMSYDGADFQAYEQLLSGSGFREFAIINDTLWGVSNELGAQNMGTNDHVNSVAYRENGTWKGHNRYSVNNTKLVNGIVSYEGDLVLGGNFSLPYPGVARHNGNNFLPLGLGVNQAVNTIIV